ncbi:hypothetical protein MNB_ARC-1_966 [hydrothermal vent metagenome]|uniref:Cytochrome c domain-containing protein n=1 Tax=hydrothermal vent metagenome TaxID=652676 RepID=A0A3B1E0G0_9ZZZZ
MKFIIFIILAIYSYSTPLSKQAKEGKKYYLEAKCQKCHLQDKKFITKGNKVTNIKKLKSWVSSCGTNFRVSWFPQDEALVVKYLNEIHYHYKK